MGRTIEAAGHRVRLIPPQYVKPFIKRSKTDSADAEAICEALRRAGIRDVAVKSREQQAALAVHRARNLLVRKRTMLTSAIQASPPSSASWRGKAPGMYQRFASI